MSYKFIDTVEELKELTSFAESYKGIIGADTESTGLDWMLDKILLLQLNFNKEIYIVDVRKLGYSEITELIVALNSSKNTLIFHNAKFDLKFIYFATGVLLENVYDTMIAEQLLTNGLGQDRYVGLSVLVEKYTDYFMDKSERSEFINFPDDMPFTEKMLQYSALDVLVLPDIVNEQLSQFNKTKQDRVVLLENQLIPVVAQMEIDGIRLNVEAWLAVEAKAVRKRNKLEVILKERILNKSSKLKVANGLEFAQAFKIPVTTKRLTKSLEEITDVSLMREWFKATFNPKSPLQMKEALRICGVKVKDTNEKTLADHKKSSKVVGTLLRIREVNKQIDSYGRNVIALIHPITGKIHTEYSTVGTQTGRFSSKKPNMQQVPTHGGYRECFIPDEGYKFMAVDYSQQEYRLAGAVSRDPRIIEAYKNGSDMHTATAQVVYGKEVVTKDERNRGKTVNFAILYGSTEFGLKNNLNISIDEAKKIIDAFWDGYKNLSDFMKFVGEKILALGYSSTPLGRRRYNLARPMFMNSKEFDRWQSRILREGRNHIIQGGGADILKIAMVEIFNRNPFGDKLKLCLQIHDELVFQVHESILKEGGEFIRDIMNEAEQRFLGDIPAKVEGFDEFKDRWSK